MFIGLANYFRDHVPNITEMSKSLRDMILVSRGANLSKKLFQGMSDSCLELPTAILSR